MLPVLTRVCRGINYAWALRPKLTHTTHTELNCNTCKPTCDTHVHTHTRTQDFKELRTVKLSGEPPQVLCSTWISHERNLWCFTTLCNFDWQWYLQRVYAAQSPRSVSGSNRVHAAKQTNPLLWIYTRRSATFPQLVRLTSTLIRYVWNFLKMQEKNVSVISENCKTMCIMVKAQRYSWEQEST